MQRHARAYLDEPNVDGEENNVKRKCFVSLTNHVDEEKTNTYLTGLIVRSIIFIEAQRSSWRGNWLRQSEYEKNYPPSAFSSSSSFFFFLPINFDMPNLTSYQAPTLHLNRENPKNYCDLLQHEVNYSHFLRTRLANIQSAFASTNPKACSYGKTRVEISHFRLRQKRWKDKIDHENQRFIQSLLYENLMRIPSSFFFCLSRYRREKYRPMHDRYAAQKSFEKHLKLLQMISEYSKYSRTYSICQKFLKNLRFNPSKTNQYSRRTTSYVENMLRQTINQAIRICKIAKQSFRKKFISM